MNRPGNKVKVVLIGDSGVGKTALFRRFEDNSFEPEQQLTVGASCCSVTIKIDDETIDFMIWDTAGQEQYRGIIPMYFHKADFVLAVYDLTQRDSFKHLEEWLKLAKECAPTSVKILVIGSKEDLGNRVVTENEVALLLEDPQICRICDTSALTGFGVRNVLLDMAVMARDLQLNTRPSDNAKVLNEECHSRNEHQKGCCRM